MKHSTAFFQAAKKRGKKLGRPGNEVDVQRFQELLSDGLTVHSAARTLGIGIGTAYRIARSFELRD